MSSKIDKYLGILLIISFIFANSALSFADDEIESISIKSDDFEETTEISTAETTPESAEIIDPNGTSDFEDSNTEKQENFMSRLKEELNLSKTDYREILNSVSDTNAKLKSLTEEKFTLEQQLKNLDDMINATTAKLFDVIKQVIEKENEIILLSDQIEVKEVAIEYQKNLIKDYVRIIYEEENNFFSLNDKGEIEAFKLLLADNSVGENLKELEYFDVLNIAGQQMIDTLTSLTKELGDQQKNLNKAKINLIELQGNLEEEKSQLELQKESKENLLSLTQGQEEIYTGLLEQTMKEQEYLLNDIKNLSNAVSFIEGKIVEEGENFNPDDYLSLLDYKTQALYSFHLTNPSINSNGFAWPVDPDRGISAYFRDSAYAGSFGVQHNAIDIPEYQGSIVRAAADGVAYTVRDNGYGYSYIILAHADGFMTVYGHISNILIAEGDSVSQGAVIGLSGGMPGSLGSGYMTTGPHLHFEMLLNGLYVDPLDYLPLEKLTEEQINALPEKYYDDWETDVNGANFEGIERF